MAKEKAKGSIVLEIIIVLLVLALIGTILYPKSVWNQKEEETISCRDNMDRILKAELIYLKYHNTYEDTLDNVLSFIKEDNTNNLIIEYVYADTALGEKILDKLKAQYPEADDIIQTYLADTLLQTILETTNYDSNLANVVLKRYNESPLQDSIVVLSNADSGDVWVLKNISEKFPAKELVAPLQEDDSLNIVLNRIEPEISIGALADTLYKNELWASKIDSAVFHTFEQIKLCPTDKQLYKISVIDTSVIKKFNVYCPIDSLEIEQSKKDFIKFFLGHLRLENHGNIKAGEKSWLGN